MSDLDDGPQQTDEPPSNRYRRAWWWGATALWMSVIFLASAWPEHGPPAAQGVDKVLHFVAYAVLMALLFGYWRAARPRLRLVASTCYAAAVVMIYGLFLELYQIGVPGRDFQWSDILANCAGVVIAALILLYSYSNRTVEEASITD